MKKRTTIFCITGLCVLLTACCDKKTILSTPVPAREAGQTDVLQLRCDPIPVVRIGFIGVGMRGKQAVARMSAIEGAEIKAVCDLEQYNIDRVQQSLAETGRPAAAEYTGENAWKELCDRDDIDLVYICTDWLTHTPMAVYAMEHGKHAAIEVPAATTVAECWQLVNTSEKTRRHCIMLENCCYDKFEMATLNMAQSGLLGEIVHVEGAYIHDLRELNFNERYVQPEDTSKNKLPELAGYWDYWRKKYDSEHTGNPYPTHGLGPVCQALNIHRGDKMNYLVSVSSNQFGMTQYAKNRFGEDSPEAAQTYELGDMNTTIIKTQKGKTILIQHDVTSPRPYNRLHTISGTKGFAQKYPVYQIALDPHAHSSLNQQAMDSLLAVYEHPFYKTAGKTAAELGSIAHGGMDFIMDYRLIYCLRNGLALDEDVYDAAEWSCLVELSEISARNNGAPVEIPDFTRGAWDKIQGLKFAE
ncbi:MAG: Gfo/Idh/MocA family oxidoreductase [Dysgonamonadaceae bacterium]|jgi:predicted dehydrogenase|nr:Gfo/Idh/MocA family oxidoreductase [Dysgonamonadaceae bacterium]